MAAAARIRSPQTTAPASPRHHGLPAAMPPPPTCLSGLFKVTGVGVLGPAWAPGQRFPALRALDDGGDGAIEAAGPPPINTQPLADPERDAYAVLAGWADPTGRYAVSAVDGGAIRAAGELQGECFYEPSLPSWLGAIDGLARSSFAAELVGALTQKLKYNPRDAFACLVARGAGAGGGAAPGGASAPALAGMSAGDPADPTALLGVVELSRQSDQEVVRGLGLTGGEGYAYVAAMAVSEASRRQGVARALLGGCEVLGRAWGVQALALHVYEDNAGALRAYEAAGFERRGTVGGGVLGGRRRLLMSKRL